MTPLDKWLGDVKQRLKFYNKATFDFNVRMRIGGDDEYSSVENFIVHAPTDLERAVKVIEIYERALQKIEDPRKRDHREPDAYTTLGCVMNIATEVLAEAQKIVEGE